MLTDGNTKYEKILEAALTVMAENGFEKTSVSDIVREAGVAQGTFYLYFSSKSAVVPALAERILFQLLTTIKETHHHTDNIYQTIRNIIDVTFHITDKYKDVIIFCYSGMAYYNSFQKWEEIYRPYYQWFEGVLQSASENKILKNNVNITHLSRMTVGLIENEAENYYLSNQIEESVETNKQEVYNFIIAAL